ncbi:MAG: type III-B CRISPR module RAMP protein Cmr6 [Saprospiraceae bacterium]|nr:type III-B CRISPR module RAMP protein Cmr6 [Candidatus Vicinibacter affinis]
MAFSPNIGWKYFYEYFKGIEFNYLNVTREADKAETAPNPVKVQLNRRNRELMSLNLRDYHPHDHSIESPQSFELETTYPGLLIGSGYHHEVKVEGELKLGLSFDYTSGLPNIPGSSVKGTLRSFWPMKSDKYSIQEKEQFKNFIQSMMAEVNQLLEKVDKNIVEEELCNGVNSIEIDKINIDHLELEIFEGVNVKETIEKVGAEVLLNNRNKRLWKYLSPSAKDVFYEAQLASISGKFLGNDYITPHLNRDRPELSPFTNPVPLQFLKVLPGIKFCFQFHLHDGLISASQKLLLFQQILLTLGIGAKTNVGYGQLTPNITAQPIPIHNHPQINEPQKVDIIPPNEDVTSFKDLEGEIEKIDGKEALSVFKTKSGSQLKLWKKIDKYFKKGENPELQLGTRVKILDAQKNGNVYTWNIRKIN